MNLLEFMDTMCLFVGRGLLTILAIFGVLMFADKLKGEAELRTGGTGLCDDCGRVAPKIGEHYCKNGKRKKGIL